MWRETLANYEAPHIDDAVDEQLRDFVARRKAEMPDRWH
jgi:trimethylamine--corrinoid protein Co-methyltransferase